MYKLRFDVETINKAAATIGEKSTEKLRFDVETINKAAVSLITKLISCCGLM